MLEEEKQAIEYLQARLYGNEGCKYIDVAQEDLRIFLNLIIKQQEKIKELEANNYEANNIINNQIDLLKDSTSNSVIRYKIEELEEYQKKVESRVKEKYSERDTLLQVIGGIYYLQELLEE